MTKQAAYELKIDMAREHIAKQASDNGIDIDAVAAAMSAEEVGDLLAEGLQELQESGEFASIDAEVDEADETDMIDVEALMKLAETDPARYVELSQNEEFLGRLSATVAMQKSAALVKAAEEKERGYASALGHSTLHGLGAAVGSIPGLVALVAAKTNAGRAAGGLGALGGSIGGSLLARHLSREKGEKLRPGATLVGSHLSPWIGAGLLKGKIEKETSERARRRVRSHKKG